MAIIIVVVAVFGVLKKFLRRITNAKESSGRFAIIIYSKVLYIAVHSRGGCYSSGGGLTKI